MLGLPLTFTVPLVLTALAALPAIWLLLRITPPQPRRVDFPPLKILADLRPEQEMPARTPWWLLLLRLLLAAFLILAAAGPIWNPLAEDSNRSPLLIVLDNGFAAAHDWRDRMNLAAERIEAAGRDGRTVALVATADAPAAIEPSSPSTALERLRSLKPLPHLQDRQAHLESVRRFLESTPDANIVWISDGVAGVDGQGFIDGLAPMAGGSRMTVLKAERAPALAVAGVENAGGQSQCQADAAPNRTGAIPARCAPSTSRACPSPTCASPSTRTPPRPMSPSTCRRKSATPSPASRSSAKAPPVRSIFSTSAASAAASGSSSAAPPIRRSRSCRRSTTSSGRSHRFRRSAMAAARWPMR